MLSVEKALGIYTDKLNTDEKIDLRYFEENLSDIDYKEFLELIKFVKLGKSIKVTDEFDKKFKELDKYKEEYYSKNPPQAAGFRGDEDSCDKEAQDKLDDIFKKEFDNE